MSVSDPSPFAGTAQYYDRYRAPYAQAAIDFVVDTYNLNNDARLLDLGCGPGSLAIPFASAVAEVVAVDPDAEMIAEGRRLAAAHDRRNIRWLHARAEDISFGPGTFRVVTMGQAFHWMDRDAVLRKLAVVVAEGGGLALIAPGQRRPQETWEPVAERVVTEFLGPRIRHPQSNPQEPMHEPALRRSEYFSEFEAHEFPSTIRRDISSIIGCIYSISSSARPLFGQKAAAFEAELSNELLRLRPDGKFDERIDTEVLIVPKRGRNG